ncbi:2'-5' RNA ligase family protein [Mycolicibacterium sp. CBM1]
MAHSIELLFDDRSDAVLRAVWHRLAAAGLPSQLRVTSETNRPHVTLIAAQRIAPDVDAQLADVAEDLPLRVVVGAPLIFGGGDRLTLARLVVASQRLLVLHDEIYGRCRSFATEPYPHSAPGHWTPHVTLGRRFGADEIGRALAEVQGIAEDIAATVVGLRRWDGDARVERVLLS